MEEAEHTQNSSFLTKSKFIYGKLSGSHGPKTIPVSHSIEEVQHRQGYKRNLRRIEAKTAMQE